VTFLSPAASYLESLPQSERRQSGLVYTPEHIVAAILEWACYDAARIAPQASLLDPACGAGVFLVAAVQMWAEHLKASGIDILSVAGRQKLLRTVEARVFGIDIDPNAVELATYAVRQTVSQICGGATLPTAFFRDNVLEADFLLGREPKRLLGRVSGGFDFIVGNPPYVSVTHLATKYKDQLRNRFVTASGRIDLYTVFMERAIGLLKSGGTLAFITPDKYLASQTAQPLRTLLLQRGSVRLIGRFRSHQVFRDAATVPCVTVFERDRQPGPMQLLDCHVSRRNSEVAVLKRSTVFFSQLTASKGWGFTAPAMSKLEQMIQGAHPTLGSRLSRLSAGLATGRDGVYVGRTGTFDVEDELLVPVVRGRDLQPFSIVDPKLAMVLPYTFDELGRPTIIKIQDYPRARRFFGEHRKDLEARHCVRVWEKAWYGLHDPMPFDIGRTPKILVPDIASYNRFVFDPGHYWPLHSVYYLVPTGINPHYLTALLNSTPIEFLIRLRAPIVKDGFSRYRKQFLTGLPVPQPTRTAEAAIVEATRAGDGASTDRLVGRLFGLTPGALDAAREFLATLRKPSRND
jgi:adenine-specific DNA-methyltransferase